MVVDALAANEDPRSIESRLQEDLRRFIGGRKPHLLYGSTP
jgi:hypothetical protein